MVIREIIPNVLPKRERCSMFRSKKITLTASVCVSLQSTLKRLQEITGEETSWIQVEIDLEKQKVKGERECYLRGKVLQAGSGYDAEVKVVLLEKEWGYEVSGDRSCLWFKGCVRRFEH